MGKYDLSAWMLVVGNIPLVLAIGWLTFKSFSNFWDSLCACVVAMVSFEFTRQTDSQDDGSIGQMVLFLMAVGVLAFLEWKVLF